MVSNLMKHNGFSVSDNGFVQQRFVALLYSVVESESRACNYLSRLAYIFFKKVCKANWRKNEARKFSNPKDAKVRLDENLEKTILLVYKSAFTIWFIFR